MKRMLVRGTKLPDGKIKCEITRLDTAEPLRSEIFIDVQQWQEFKLTALDPDRMKLAHYEFEADWESHGNDTMPFAEKVKYKLVEEPGPGGWGRPPDVLD